CRARPTQRDGAARSERHCRDRAGGGDGGRRARPARHPRQQRRLEHRSPVPRSGRADGRYLGPHPGGQPARAVLPRARGRALSACARRRSNRQRGLGRRSAGGRQQHSLRRGQGRTHPSHALPRGGDGSGSHRQLRGARTDGGHADDEAVARRGGGQHAAARRAAAVHRHRGRRRSGRGVLPLRQRDRPGAQHRRRGSLPLTSCRGGDVPLSFGSRVARLALIGVVLSVAGGGFAYLGGWLTPRDLTPARFTDGFQSVNGVHPGFRRNHAKGLGVSGFFDSNGSAVRVSKAAVFRAGRLPVIGRFSLSGGQPYVADSADAVRGLGLQFSLPDGELWRTAMISLPVFPFRTPQAFYEQLIASKADSRTGKPNPAAMQAFLERHPETAQVLSVIKSRPVASAFDNTTFYGLNAFRVTNASGTSTPVRWILTPLQPFEAAGGMSAAHDKNYLFEAVIA